MLGEYVTKTKILKICQKSIIISEIDIKDSCDVSKYE